MTRVPFEKVGQKGNVFFFEKLGQLELSKTLRLPILLVFDSNSAQYSPYAGRQFALPLLQSNIVAVDENKFILRGPDGWDSILTRDKKDPNILRGRGHTNWMAEIRGDFITVTGDGGNRMVFRRGKITELQLKDGEQLRKFDYIYSGELVSEIREADKTLIKVDKDTKTGDILGFDLGRDGHIGLESTKKPQVMSMGGQNVVVGMESALSRLVTAEGVTKTFEFGVDSKVRPTLKIGGNSEEEIIWNPETSSIYKCGEWIYEIKPSPNVDQFGSYAEIARKNNAGESESWNLDLVKGEEAMTGIDGTKRVRRWFTTGEFAYRLRKITEEKPGQQPINVFSPSYDSLGRLVRLRESDGTELKWEYDGDSRRATKEIRNDSPVFEREYDKNGRKVREIIKGSSDIAYEYYSGTQLKSVKKTESNGNALEQSFDQNGRLVQYTLRNGEKIISKVNYVYNSISDKLPSAFLTEAGKQIPINRANFFKESE